MKKLHERILPLPKKAPDFPDPENPKDNDFLFSDLWDQVYATLTDAGDDRVYDAIGKGLSGKNNYFPTDLLTGSLNNTTDVIVVKLKDKDPSWAYKVCELYGLNYKEGTSHSWGPYIKIFVPKDQPIQYDKLGDQGWAELLKARDQGIDLKTGYSEDEIRDFIYDNDWATDLTEREVKKKLLAEFPGLNEADTKKYVAEIMDIVNDQFTESLDDDYPDTVDAFAGDDDDVDLVNMDDEPNYNYVDTDEYDAFANDDEFDLTSVDDTEDEIDLEATEKANELPDDYDPFANDDEFDILNAYHESFNKGDKNMKDNNYIIQEALKSLKKKSITEGKANKRPAWDHRGNKKPLLKDFLAVANDRIDQASEYPYDDEPQDLGFHRSREWMPPTPEQIGSMLSGEECLYSDAFLDWAMTNKFTGKDELGHRFIKGEPTEWYYDRKTPDINRKNPRIKNKFKREGLTESEDYKAIAKNIIAQNNETIAMIKKNIENSKNILNACKDEESKKFMQTRITNLEKDLKEIEADNASKQKLLGESLNEEVSNLTLKTINHHLLSNARITDSRITSDFNWYEKGNRPEKMIIFGVENEENYIYTLDGTYYMEGPYGRETFNSLEELDTIIDSYGGVRENLNENADMNAIVGTLPEQPVEDFIKNVPAGRYFHVGVRADKSAELLATKYVRGDLDKKTGEKYPKVVVVKCTELYGSTGTDYENKAKTQQMRAETGKERSGNRYELKSEADEINRISKTASGNKLLQFFPRSNSHPYVKYFISVDGEDFRECDKREIAQYATPGKANELINGKQKSDQPQGADIVRISLSKIYYIGNLGHSIM